MAKQKQTVVSVSKSDVLLTHILIFLWGNKRSCHLNTNIYCTCFLFAHSLKQQILSTLSYATVNENVHHSSGPLVSQFNNDMCIRYQSTNELDWM